MNLVDLLLAVLHHLLAFSLAAVLAAEAALLWRQPSHDTLRRLSSVDLAFGILAVLIILVGTGRVFFGLKGWQFYIDNPVFWAKMAAFLMVGLLSIRPTTWFLKWSRAAAADPAYEVPAAELAFVRRSIGWEIVFFALIPVFAAAMARGYGY
jgi:putative membrane protein